MKHATIHRQKRGSGRAIAFLSFASATFSPLAPKALAHGGHDHSKRETPSSEEGSSDQSPSLLPEAQPQPSTESVPTSNTPPPSSTDADSTDVDSTGTEGNQTVQMMQSEPDNTSFNVGEVGTGELLFVLIIVIPFLLKAFRHGLHSSRA